MALDQAWYLAFTLPIILVGLTVFGFLLNRKKFKALKTMLVSNTNRFVDTPEYRKAVASYKFGLTGIIVLMIISMLVLSVVASKPVQVESTPVTKYNRDIVLCLDVSGSMVDVDNAIVEKFEELVEDFKGERVGLVVWNSSSHMVFPLTDDYEYIKENLAEVGYFFEYYSTKSPPAPGSPPPKYDLSKYTMNGDGGSLIGDGLVACGLAFDQEGVSEKRSKSIILATDNVINGEPIIELDAAVEYVTDEGITIYGIKPTTGWEIGNEAEEMQYAIEEINGGKYYELDNPSYTKEIVDQVTSEEATAKQGPPVITKTDTPQLWIFGVAVLVITVLGLMWRFKV